MPGASLFGIGQEFEQPCGSDLCVAAVNEFFDFGPVDRGQVKAETNPSARSDVGGEIEFAGIGGDKMLIVARERLTADAYNAVIVMVVEVVSEDLFADRESRVGLLVFAHSLRKGEADCR